MTEIMHYGGMAGFVVLGFLLLHAVAMFSIEMSLEVREWRKRRRREGK